MDMMIRHARTVFIRRCGTAPRLAALLALFMTAPLSALHPQQAPPLPPPDPAVYTIIHVDSAQQLADACWNLASNQAIVIAPGTYDLATVDFPNGVDGRLTVGRFGAATISNIQIRGASGNPADVLIRGGGMLDPSVPYGFQVFTARDVLIADLGVGEVYYHAIGIEGTQGARDIRLYNLHAYDAGQQIIKGSGAGADDVRVEFSQVYYRVGAVAHPHGSPPGSCYTNGIDVTGGDRWIIRDNRIARIRCQDGTLAGPSILIWQGASDTVIERNTLLDSSRGIALGLVSPSDHSGGIIRNNVISWNADAGYAVDVPIYTTSPNARILHNSARTAGRYANAVEVRFAGAVNIEVAGNLTDAAIIGRNGATPMLSGNLTQAQDGWYVDAAAGDLRLTASAQPAMNQVDRHAFAVDDFSGHSRRAPPARTDLGAHEYRGDTIFADGFDSVP